MPLIKWDPFSSDRWSSMLSDMENAFSGLTSKTDFFSPSVDMYEEDKNLIAKVEIADIDPDNIEVHVKDGMLSIQGKTEEEKKVDKKNYYVKEISSGSFYRTITLPKDVKEDKVSADWEDGILKVTMPLLEKKEVEPKKVKVSVKNKKSKKSNKSKKSKK
jgi:HSP20 family protein